MLSHAFAVFECLVRSIALAKHSNLPNYLASLAFINATIVNVDGVFTDRSFLTSDEIFAL